MYKGSKNQMFLCLVGQMHFIFFCIILFSLGFLSSFGLGWVGFFVVLVLFSFVLLSFVFLDSLTLQTRLTLNS